VLLWRAPVFMTLALMAGACQGNPATSATVARKSETPVTDYSDANRDIHSFARPADARVTHVALDLVASFSEKRLSGTATLTVVGRPGATTLVLDTRDLEILSVTTPGGAALVFALADPDPILGRALTVTLPAQREPVVVTYRTSPGSAALQWLAPEQTAG
jgi:leukotriene-A4 hydrolase